MLFQRKKFTHWLMRLGKIGIGSRAVLCVKFAQVKLITVDTIVIFKLSVNKNEKKC